MMEDVEMPDDVKAEFNPAFVTHLVNIRDVETAKSFPLLPKLEIDVSILYLYYY